MTNKQLITLPKNNDSETFLSAITYDLGVFRDILPTEFEKLLKRFER